MAQQRVLVVKRGNACFAIPASVVATAGDTVKWFNLTGGGATVIFPHDGVFGVGVPGQGFGQRIKDTQDHQPGNPVQAGLRHCPYKIYCEITDSFAVGSSDPEIIVN